MGRNRSFQEADVVTAAASAFLATGYEGTSIDDLVRVTGLHRGSLYKAFGSKRGLFLAALRQHQVELSAASEDLDLLLVATLELAPRDGEVRALVRDLLIQIDSPDPARLLGARLLQRAQLAIDHRHT